MPTIPAVIKNGRIEPLKPIDLPEGTSLLITVVDGASELAQQGSTQQHLAPEIATWNQRAIGSQATINRQIQTDLELLTERGEPIYYSQNGKLICEDANGRKFEYRPLADGSEELRSEIID
jgi:predicted DNA-binding antitoxin AbrB/MazE fold protein